MRVLLELYRTADGHFCGRIARGEGGSEFPFYGVLGLVGLLEDLDPEEPPEAVEGSAGLADPEAGGRPPAS